MALEAPSPRSVKNITKAFVKAKTISFKEIKKLHFFIILNRKVTDPLGSAFSITYLIN